MTTLEVAWPGAGGRVRVRKSVDQKAELDADTPAGDQEIGPEPDGRDGVPAGRVPEPP